MKAVFLALAASSALLLLSAAARSANWVAVGVDAQGSAWHVDADSIVRDGGSVTAWKRIEFRSPYPQLRKGAPFKSAFVLNDVDCAGQRASLKAIGLLDPEGSIMAVHESGAGTDWPPGARLPVLKAALSFVCGEGQEHAPR